MKHLNEEELVMLYYGEEAADRREHLAGCAACRTAFEALEAALGSVDLPVPERDDEYGAAVWARLRPKLERGAPRIPFWHSLFATRRWAAAAAMAALVIAAFLAGRFWPWHGAQAPDRAGTPQVRERILLVAVGDHLERSQMVLLELMNADPQHKSVDISDERERARNLIASNRLYRQTAARAGDPGVATVLDDLERVLLEVAHSPSQLSSQQFEELRQRVEAQGILFKVHVIDSQLKRETRRSS
jgi:hypothetical protein